MSLQYQRCSRMCLELSLYQKRKMLLARDSEGSKSYLERLRGVSCLIGKSLGSCLIGKRGRSLGIRCFFRGLIVFLLSLSFWLLTVSPSWVGKGLFGGLTDLLLRSEWLTDLLLRSEGLTDPLLWSDSVLRDLEHVLGQLVPMSCRFRGSLSI